MGLFDNFPTIVTTIKWAVLALIAIYVYISYGNIRRGGQGLRTSIENIMTFSTLNAAIFCLIVVICVCQILIAKIRGYYDGLYSFNSQENNDTGITGEQYDSGKFPIPYGYKMMNSEYMTSADVLTLLAQQPTTAGTTINTLIVDAVAANDARTAGTDASVSDAAVDAGLDQLWRDYETALAPSGMSFINRAMAQEIKAGFDKLLNPSSDPTAAADAATAHKYKPAEAEAVWMIPIAAKKDGIPQWFNLGIPGANWKPVGRDANLAAWPTATYWGPIYYQTTGTLPSGKPYVSLFGLQEILRGITVLQWATIVLLFAVILFNNFPLQYSNFPGQYGPTRTVKTFVMILGLLMALLTAAVFSASLSKIAEYNGMANLGNKHKVTVDVGTDKQGNVIKQDYYFPTKVQQVYPPLNQLSGWFYVLILGMSIATGLAFATIKSDIPGNAYKIMKIKSGLVSELKHTGSLIAYEMKDPLFKLIDSAIAKKAARKQVAPVVEEILENGRIKHKIRIPKEEITKDDDTLAIANVIPRLAEDTPIKLFDFVTVDGYNAANGGQPIIWLVAAADGFTILKHKRKHRQYYSTVPNSTGGAPIPEEFRWTVSKEEMNAARTGGTEVDPNRSPHKAEFAIFGNNDYKYEPDYIHNIRTQANDEYLNDDIPMGAISPEAKITLIPLDSDAIEDMIVKSRMTNEEFNEALKAVSRKFYPTNPDARDRIVNHIGTVNTLYSMVKDIIEYDFANPLGTRFAPDDTGSTWKSILKIRDSTGIRAYNDFINSKDMDEAPYGRSVSDDDSPDASLFPNTQGILTPHPRLTGLSVGIGSPIKLYRRLVENHNMVSVTALDLIHLRYSLVKDLLFRQVAQYSGQDAEKIRQLYQNREKHFPTNNPRLLQTLLPELKKYVDPEVRQEYDREVHPMWPAGYDENKIVEHDIDTFARRFNEMMKIQTTPYHVNNTPPWPTTAQREHKYSINEPVEIRKRRTGPVRRQHYEAQKRAFRGPDIGPEESVSMAL